MIRCAASLPPAWGRIAPARMASGIMAVSALEASAMARSNPATRWKRLSVRRTNAGRSQNVRVRRIRSRLTCGRRRFAAAPRAGSLAMAGTLAPRPATGNGACRSDRRSAYTTDVAGAEVLAVEAALPYELLGERLTPSGGGGAAGGPGEGWLRIARGVDFQELRYEIAD